MADNEKTGGMYSVHPIQNYKIGDFRFVGGLLTLTDPDEIAAFEAILADPKLPASERARIKKIDVGLAHKLVAERLATKGGATKAIDSTVGERASDSPKIGKGDLHDSNPKPEDEAKIETADILDAAAGGVQAKPDPSAKPAPVAGATTRIAGIGKK